jgi:hypothetical protein
MRLVLKMFKFLFAIVPLGILGFSGWLTFSPPDGLMSASAYAAKMVARTCSLPNATRLRSLEPT